MIDHVIKDSADNIINDQNIYNSTPLHLALYYRLINSVRMLLEQGAKIDIKESNGKTALDLARENNNESI